MLKVNDTYKFVELNRTFHELSDDPADDDEIRRTLRLPRDELARGACRESLATSPTVAIARTNRKPFATWESRATAGATDSPCGSHTITPDSTATWTISLVSRN
jgi:hypothetical protein